MRMKCLLVYDIPHDGTRTKIADFCLDYGLDRIQYSAFLGDLARTHQEELMLRVGERLGDRAGKIQLFVMCRTDWRQRLEIIQERDEDGG
jgi:CRISPR-associated protein Cas2